MITWEPWTRSFPEFKSDPDLSRNRKVFHAILAGRLDKYIFAYAQRLRDYHRPVLLRFAHEPDNPAYPWSQTGGNTPDEYIAAWQYIVNFLKRMGASNVAWVWNPWQPSGVTRYFPGAAFFDWFGLTSLNYGQAAQDGKWYSFEQLYTGFQAEFAKLGIEKPTMLAEFGSTAYGGNRGKWLGEALGAVASRHPEIRAIVFFHSDRDRNWATSWRPPGNPPFIDWTFIPDDGALEQVRAALVQPAFNDSRRYPVDLIGHARRPTRHQSSIAGAPGHFELIVDNKPFYIRGVAYNVGHEWRDGYHPMTRRLIDEDFAQIKAMGANTIRRYGVSMADYNILAAAQDHGLKVLYGFWFESDVDYLDDRQTLRQYEQLVTATVMKYKDNPAILGWSLGNEVWGLLKHRFAPPYLTEVRNAYLDFIERLAQEIHQLDPKHPVLMVSEHSWELPGELFEAARAAPSIDVLGINSYYVPYVRQLDAIVGEYNWWRPYLVSEFGPPGYWDNAHTKFDRYREPVEPSGAEKAALYAQQWKDYVAGKCGHNLGGVAFTWRDRMEQTFTWFGLTDYAGRPKPSYYALRQVWTGQPPDSQPMLGRVEGPDEARPGSVVQFAAPVVGSDRPSGGHGLKLQWDLRRDNIFETDAEIMQSDDGSRAMVRMPQEPGNYRLYVYLSTPSNTVDTASFNIHVR